MNQTKIYLSLAELKADVRRVVLAEMAEIRGQELSEDDILALAERFRGWPAAHTKKSLQLELTRLRGRLEAAMSYGKHEDAADLRIAIGALEWAESARAAKRAYPLPTGPRWMVLDNNHMRRAFGRYCDQMSGSRSRALVSLLTHLTLGVGEFPAEDFRSATVEKVIQDEIKAILSLRDRWLGKPPRLPEILVRERMALRFYAELDRKRLTSEQLEQLERRLRELDLQK